MRAPKDYSCMKKKVLFVAINSSWYQSNPAFYYLRAIAEGIISEPKYTSDPRIIYESKIISFTTQDLHIDVLSAIVEEASDILCFSAYIWNRVYLERLLPDIRALEPDAVFVVGGPEAKNLEDMADFCIEGPGEARFRQLATFGFSKEIKDGFTPLERNGDNDSSHPGFSKETMEKATPIPLQELPFPYRPEDKSELGGKLVYYETHRGCPFSCAYCLSSRDRRNERRFDKNQSADMAKLSSELDALEALGPRTVKFVDRSFNISPEFARALWKLLLSKERACEFHFEIYPEYLEEEDILLLEKAPPGLIRFETGVQSTSDVLNLASGRKSNWAKTKAMLCALHNRTKITVHADLLCGLPDQSMDRVLDSIDELAPCLPEEIQLGILKILPDTPMLDIAQKRGWLWIESPPYTILQTDTMDFRALRKCEALARILNLYWNKGEFSHLWPDLLQKRRASELLNILLDYHQEHHLPLHSISKKRREEVFLAADYAGF